ncbi:MAG: FAD-dependent oxidoreductase [Caldimonas sp.]
MTRLDRRTLLAGAALAPLLACTRSELPSYSGGWVGANAERGHRLRDRKAAGVPAPEFTRRAGAIVVGAGVSGLAAARELARAGIDDVQLLDLENEPGGNSRGHRIAGMRCPLGAHYLPVPGERASEVIELLDELKLRRVEHGRVVYDERALCHTPQERLFIDGAWREGLLPPVDALPAGERAATLAQYRAFSARVAQLAGGGDAFAMPTARSVWSSALSALDAQTFAAWLDAAGFTAPALRWYLDYCCRDDYGAGAAQVSAWAGIHYFASRHGFRAPGRDEGGDGGDSGVLTWPEGNAWLAERMAAPLAGRIATGLVVLRVDEEREAVVVDAWNTAAARLERWICPQVVLATPLFVAKRLLATANAALSEAVSRLPQSPWLVANLHLDTPLDDRPGAPPSWDNVLYGSRALGYVDDQHQSLRPFAGPTVLTVYWALGGNSAAELSAGRAALLGEGWASWAARVVADVATAHPDLPARVRRVDLTRYGHAMSVPVPGLRSSAALQSLAAPQRRVQFAHADLSAYSVFEEAIYHGTRAGRAAAAGLAAG